MAQQQKAYREHEAPGLPLTPDPKMPSSWRNCCHFLQLSLLSFSSVLFKDTLMLPPPVFSHISGRYY